MTSFPKIFITGGAGYIGSSLTLRLLAQGYAVTVLDSLRFQDHSLQAAFSYDKFRFIKGDVRDEALLKNILQEEKPDYIVPLAALVGAPLCDRFPEEAKAVNLEAIRLLLKIIPKNQKIIYPTTNSGYGTKSGQFHCNEETPLEPISLYGQTKVEAEKLILTHPEAITLRLATIFGLSPRMRFDLLVNFMVLEIFKNNQLEVFQGDFKRNFIHIDDIGDCFLFCLNNFHKLKGNCYNVGLDEANLSKKELALKVVELFGRGTLTFNDHVKDPDQRNYFVSSQKMMAQGFKAKRSIESGILQLKNYLEYKANFNQSEERIF